MVSDNDASPLVVALDVGGTTIKAGLVGPDGRVVTETRQDTRVAAGVNAVVDGIVELAQELIAAAPAGARVRAVGLGVPGVVESGPGIARYAANLGWRDLPLVDLLQSRVRLPVALGHDVRNAALAEARLGAGAGADPGATIFFISIGTGIAGGLVRGGRVEEGDSGQAGEVGHLVVRPGGPRCGCGNLGCLEAIASASRIAGRYAAVTGEQLSAAQVAARVRAKEPAAVEIWTDAVAALADALAAVSILTDPGHIVIGGGLSLAGDTLTAPLRPALAEKLTFRSAPPLSLTVLADRAGLVGAALLAWDLLWANDRRDESRGR